MPSKADLRVEDVRRVLRYEPETGNLIWQGNARRVPIGSVAGAAGSYGYLQVTVFGVNCSAHRLAWFIYHGEWPSGHLDHINGLRSDNRIANLRVASRFQQNGNIKGKSKKGMPKGVTPNGSGFYASVKRAGRRQYLGQFPTPELAHEAYCAAAKQMFGEFFCDGRR